jgi:hypothetical protein
MLFSDGFPDQVGDIDDQIGSGLAGTTGCASLASAHTDDVVQPGMGLAVGQVEQDPHDLAAPRKAGAAIPVQLPP